jgi:calcium/calmodulin-dependent protein kinase I
VPSEKQYSFGQLLGDGSFGQVKRATWTTHVRGILDVGCGAASESASPQEPPIDVAIKVIKKKLVKGNEKIVYDGLRPSLCLVGPR